MHKALTLIPASFLFLAGVALGMAMGEIQTQTAIKQSISVLEEPVQLFRSDDPDPLHFDQCVKAGGLVERNNGDSKVTCVVRWLNARQVRAAIR